MLGKLSVPGRPTSLDGSRAGAYCACSRCGLGLFGHFFSRLSVLFSSYGENLIARCSQVHDNFTMGVNRKILINLIYLFIQETYLTCANGL